MSPLQRGGHIRGKWEAVSTVGDVINPCEVAVN